MMTEMMGYKVEKVGTEKYKVNYLLYGPRAVYRLIRCRRGFLFAINSNGNTTALKGNYGFRDDDGELRPIYGS